MEERLIVHTTNGYFELPIEEGTELDALQQALYSELNGNLRFMTFTSKQQSITVNKDHIISFEVTKTVPTMSRW